MENTMADLREEVAIRMRNALHGREIDEIENVVEVPHMLGITPIGKIHDPQNEEMTLMDPNHQFWREYEGNIDTENKVMEKIETAIRSMHSDGTFEKTYPYGEDAGIVYVEVEPVRDDNSLTTECSECGETIDTTPTLENQSGRYVLKTTLDCPQCDFTRVLQTTMLPQ